MAFKCNECGLNGNELLDPEFGCWCHAEHWIDEKPVKNMVTRINNLKDIWQIQNEEPSVEYDRYMLGLFNGLELALATIEDREPKYRQLTRIKKHPLDEALDELEDYVNGI